MVKGKGWGEKKSQRQRMIDRVLPLGLLLHLGTGQPRIEAIAFYAYAAIIAVVGVKVAVGVVGIVEVIKK